jgi:hypothetical protein
MQLQINRPAIHWSLIPILALALFGQEPSKRGVTITPIPPEPIAVGTCTSSTFGYLEWNGKRTGFTEAEFGHMLMPALRQGDVLTIYPPTKSGTFVNSECHGTAK